jgi:hypothetical protein
MDQFRFLVGLLRLLVIVTALTVLAFVADLNGFSMLTFASGTKDIFGLVLYFIPLFADEQAIRFSMILYP